MYSNAMRVIYPIQSALTDDVTYQLPSEQTDVQRPERWIGKPWHANNESKIQTS